MNWQNLLYFEVIAQEESITKASKRLHVTQSALSKAMNNLEKLLGVPLFDRVGRNIQLNKYGKHFYNYVITATKEISEGIESVQSMAGLNEAGIINIESIFTLGASYIPRLLKTFTNDHPGVRIEYNQKNTYYILNNLVEGNIDLGFCGEYEQEDFPELDKEMIASEELFLVVSPQHRLADRDHVYFGDVMDEDFIGWSFEGAGIPVSIRQTLRMLDMKDNFHYIYYVSEDNTAVEMVRQGLAIAFIADAPSVNFAGVKCLHISDTRLERKLYIVWNRNCYMSPIVKKFKYFVLSKY